MKKRISLLLVLAMVLSVMVPMAGATGSLSGKTMLIYTADLRGDVDVYPQIAAWKAYYEAEGAEVLVVDGGNHLQGSRFANFDRGESIYRLMDAVGYDLAVMGSYDYAYGAATTGYAYHGNFHRDYTQAQLLLGCEELTYPVNANGSTTATRPARKAAGFTVIGSEFAGNLTDPNYAFADYALLTTSAGLAIGFYGVFEGTSARELVQDGLLDSFVTADPAQRRQALEALGPDLVIGLESNASGDPTALSGDPVIVADGSKTVRVYMIDNETLDCTLQPLPSCEVDSAVADIVAEIKARAEDALFTNEVVLEGRDSVSRNGETNLGDLVTDALKWYAEEKFEGFSRDVPVVALQNGGNLDQFLLPGDVTATDLLCALPFSPMGVGILYVTGAQLAEMLEAGTYAPNCSGFPHVAGLTYTVHTYKPFDAGEAYGKFFRANSVNRVVIESVNGKPFSETETYAVIADNFLMNGNDTYYLFKELKTQYPDRYLNNGNGMKTRDIVAKYVSEVLGGTVTPSAYGATGDRIQLLAAAPVVPFVNPFTDVKEHHWFYADVMFCAENGLFNGTTATTFSPMGAMDRAMMITVLYRFCGSPDVTGFENPFADVADDAYYAEAVIWCVENGIVNGKSDTRFDPRGKLTREQAATILYRAADLFGIVSPSESTGPIGLPDFDRVSDYARDAVRWTIQTGIIQGTVVDGVEMIHPRGTLSRAQMATILARFVRYLSDQ